MSESAKVPEPSTPPSGEGAKEAATAGAGESGESKKKGGGKKDEGEAEEKGGGRNKSSVNLGRPWLMAVLLAAAVVLALAIKEVWDVFRGAATETDRAVAAQEDAAREKKRADDAKRAKAEPRTSDKRTLQNILNVQLGNNTDEPDKRTNGTTTGSQSAKSDGEPEEKKSGDTKDDKAKRDGDSQSAKSDGEPDGKTFMQNIFNVQLGNNTDEPDKRTNGTAKSAASWDVLMDENIKRIARAHGIDPDSMKPGDIPVLRLARQQEEFVRSTEAKAAALKAEVEASRNKLDELQTQLEAARSTTAKASDGRLKELEAAVEEARKEAEQLKVKIDASEATRAKLEATLKAAGTPAPTPKPEPAPATPSAPGPGT